MEIAQTRHRTGIPTRDLAAGITAAVLALVCLVGRNREEADIARLPLPVLGFLYWLMITLVLSAGNQRPEFIYFQF